MNETLDGADQLLRTVASYGPALFRPTSGGALNETGGSRLPGESDPDRAATESLWDVCRSAEDSAETRS